MKDGSGFRIFLTTAILLLVTALAWLTGGDMPLRVESRSPEDLKTPAHEKKEPEIKTVQMPIMVRKVAPVKKEKEEQKLPKKEEKPKKAEVEKPLPKKEEKAPERAVKPVSDAGGGTAGGTGAPNLFAGYEMPVKDYLASMRSKGAKVFVYSNSSDRLVGEVLEDGSLASPSGTEGLSRRSRRLTEDFPGGREVLTMAEERFGPGGYEILLLLPEKLEEAINENVAGIIDRAGLGMDDVTTVFMAYRGDGFGVSVHVEKAAGTFGVRQIGESFSLGGR